MDKKTLFAFLIIAVIILLTPKYYNIIAPSIEPDGTDSAAVTAQKATYVQTPYTPPSDKEALPLEQKSIHEETYSVNTELYSATVSSTNGGSLISFTLNNYSYLNSGPVQLINDRNQQNLLLSFRSVDGEYVKLSGPWEPVNNVSPGFISSEFSLRFRKALGNSWVYKTVTFYPDNYIINIKTDLSSAEPFISQGIYSLSWVGGLPITEKNVSDDITYFDAYIYQGGELHSPKLTEKEEPKEDNIIGETAWAAVRTKYFVSALIPDVPGLGGKTSGYKSGDIEKVYSVALSLSAHQHKTSGFTWALWNIAELKRWALIWIPS